MKENSPKALKWNTPYLTANFFFWNTIIMLLSVGHAEKYSIEKRKSSLPCCEDLNLHACLEMLNNTTVFQSITQYNCISIYGTTLLYFNLCNIHWCNCLYFIGLHSPQVSHINQTSQWSLHERHQRVLCYNSKLIFDPLIPSMLLEPKRLNALVAYKMTNCTITCSNII